MIKKYLFLLTLLCLTQLTRAQMDYSPGFEAGAPDEISWFDFLKGEWDITLKWTNDPESDKDSWVVIGKSESSVSDLYNGAFLTETSEGFPIQGGHEGYDRWRFTAVHSYDRFQKVYRTLFFDNILALADIYEGTVENDVLTLSNEKTSTFNNMGTNQGAQKNKLIIRKLSDKSFEVTWLNIDKAKLEGPDSPWQLAVYMLYTRKDQARNH